MTFTPTGKLIHLCIDNLQEKTLCQQHNKVICPQYEPITKSKLKTAFQDPVEDLRDYFYISLPL